ncbi:MAG: DUF1934 domain-containing protein [Lactococcus lactis]
MIMEIIIRNRIKIDQQEELVKEIYQGELKKGEHQTLLKYQNAANEKVLLKFDENEVIMTRFAKRPIKMHFHPEIPGLTEYEGLGELSILTNALSIDHESRTIKINYQLSQGAQKIADYHLRIDWREQNVEGETNG